MTSESSKADASNFSFHQDVVLSAIENPVEFLYLIVPALYVLASLAILVTFIFDVLLAFWRIRDGIVPGCTYYPLRLFVKPFSGGNWKTNFDGRAHDNRVGEFYGWGKMKWQMPAIAMAFWTFYLPGSLLWAVTIFVTDPIIQFLIFMAVIFLIAPRVYNGYIKNRVGAS